MAKKKKKRRPTHSRASSTRVTLSDEWRAWASENLAAGVSNETIVDALVSSGVPIGVAQSELVGIQKSSAFVGCKRLHQRLKVLEKALRLKSTHLSFGVAPRAVERRPTVDADEFYDRYYAGNIPVVLTDVVGQWEAKKWTPELLKQRFSTASVEVCSGRSTDPECDKNFSSHQHTVLFGEFVDQVLSAGETNDLYLIANNHLLEKSEFQSLLDEVSPDPEIFDMTRTQRAASFWFGPAGTLTPLHHDVSNILFCQIYGKKRVLLAPPTESALLSRCRGFYVDMDLEEQEQHPELSDVLIKQVDLEAGEALFIPAGWFHQVRSLEVSINFSLLNFRRPNNFDWFRPGESSAT